MNERLAVIVDPRTVDALGVTVERPRRSGHAAEGGVDLLGHRAGQHVQDLVAAVASVEQSAGVERYDRDRHIAALNALPGTTRRAESPAQTRERWRSPFSAREA